MIFTVKSVVRAQRKSSLCTTGYAREEIKNTGQNSSQAFESFEMVR